MVNPIFVEIWIFINSSTTIIALSIRKAEYIPATVNGIAKKYGRLRKKCAVDLPPLGSQLLQQSISVNIVRRFCELF